MQDKELYQQVLGLTIKERLSNVVSYRTHRIIKAVAEGMNSKIMSIRGLVDGIRILTKFKLAVFFHCHGMDRYPRKRRMVHRGTNELCLARKCPR